MNQPPIIALLTDFGTKDYFVAAMKGAILSIVPAAQIVDVTHEIAPQDIAAGAFALRACYRNFPWRTIFTAVVDPGVGSARRALLVATESRYFIAPDNGLLSFVFDEAESFRVFELTERRYFAAEISTTFHGRDVFAPVAAHLASGVAPDAFGQPIDDFVRLASSRPRRAANGAIEGEIIEIDRFGNLITNLKREDLPDAFTVEIKRTHIRKLQSFFAEADAGELFMIFGSAGFLEIVAFRTSAARLLGAARGEKFAVRVL